MNYALLMIDAWLNQMGFYLSTWKREGWAAMVSVVRIARRSKRMAQVYGYIDREAHQHDEQMTYLRVELDQCRTRLYQAQRALQDLRGARS